MVYNKINRKVRKIIDNNNLWWVINNDFKDIDIKNLEFAITNDRLSVRYNVMWQEYAIQ